MQLIKHKNSIYENRDLGNGFIGFVPSKLTIQDGDPSLSWTKGKIPLSVWREIIAFFQWSYEESKSETQVRLLYNPETEEWKAWAFPQEYGTGMTAKELSDTEGYIDQLNEQLAGGFLVFGTVHHHCSSSAFQSGVDTNDEKTVMGLHVTVGNIGSSRHSIHGRVTLIVPGTSVSDPAKQAFYAARFSDWFEVDSVNPQWPGEIQEKLIEWTLSEPVPKDHLFPNQWALNLVKKPVTTLITAHHQWSSMGSTPIVHHAASNNPLLKHWEPRREMEDHRGYEADWGDVAHEEWMDRLEFEQINRKIEDIMLKYDVSYATLHGMNTLPDELLSDILTSDLEAFEEVEKLLSEHLLSWDRFMALAKVYARA